MSENRTRFRLDQRRAPIYEALEQFRQMRVVPFDVPGHKRGRGNPELTAFLGQQCVGVDVNSMKPLDNLCHPVSVIREAEELAADAFGAAHAFLMVGGTTSSVQSMVLTACKRGDEIILPRNVHRSVLNALVLCPRCRNRYVLEKVCGFSVFLFFQHIGMLHRFPLRSFPLRLRFSHS